MGSKLNIKIMFGSVSLQVFSYVRSFKSFGFKNVIDKIKTISGQITHMSQLRL